MRKMIISAFMVLLSVSNLLCSQTRTPSGNGPMSTVPVIADDGWRTGNLKNAGIDSAKIIKIVDGIRDSTYQGIHSMLIVKDGALVFEVYFPGYAFEYKARRFRGDLIDHDSNTIHNLASVTKSVTGLLVGIAFDQGLLRDVGEKAAGFFPRYAFRKEDRINQVTLHHLLTMTSGLKWNESDLPYSSPENDIIRLFLVADPVQYILSQPVVDEPGTRWYYNGGGTNLLGEIIHQTARQPMDDFAERYLFSPLGITRYKWIHIKPEVVYASGNLELRPRDLAKLGYLVLNDGIWNGRRIVSSSWIKTMVQKHVSFSDTRGYGYQWWQRTYVLGSLSIDCCYAAGWGGQYILVFPSLNAVVVFTGGNYDQRDPTDEIVQKYLLPALITNDQQEAAADHRTEFERISKEAPMPDDLSIVPPSAGLGADLRSLSGHWYGRWDYASASQFVVEKVEPGKASIVYSFPGKGWMRREAVITSSGRIEFGIGTSVWSFGLEEDKDVLVGFYRDDRSSAKIVMKRKDN